MSIKVDSARKDLAILNEKFRNREAFSPGDREEIYRQLVKIKNVDLNYSVLISWMPEGDDFYSGRIIDQKGKIFHFDIHVKNSDFTEWDDDFPVDEYEKLGRFKALKPWNDNKLAIELWHELHGNS